jgi:ribosomal protein L28
MSKICMSCEKGYLKANLVPRGIGRRVTKRTIIRRQPNLQSKRFVIGGRSLKLLLCTSCLKRIKYEDRLVAAQAAAKVATA